MDSDGLAERVRGLLAGQPVVREKPMFGGVSFMVNEKMVVSARNDGGLLVRVPTARHEELVRRPGASQAVMGPTREMGPGWITVDPAALAVDADLAAWIGIALEHNSAVTGT